MMNRGRMVFSRNRSEGTYSCASMDSLVLYVCERVPREGWLPLALYRNPMTRRVVRQFDLAPAPVPLREARRRCDAHHREHIFKTGSVEQIDYIERWTGVGA